MTDSREYFAEGNIYTKPILCSLSLMKLYRNKGVNVQSIILLYKYIHVSFQSDIIYLTCSYAKP